MQGRANTFLEKIPKFPSPPPSRKNVPSLPILLSLQYFPTTRWGSQFTYLSKSSLTRSNSFLVSLTLFTCLKQRKGKYALSYWITSSNTPNLFSLISKSCKQIKKINMHDCLWVYFEVFHLQPFSRDIWLSMQKLYHLAIQFIRECLEYWVRDNFTNLLFDKSLQSGGYRSLSLLQENLKKQKIIHVKQNNPI